MEPPHRLSHMHFDETPQAELRRFLAARRVQGLRFGNSSRAETFIPKDELLQFLGSPGKLEALLESACHKRFTRADIAAVEDRLLILSILVLIDRGDLIDYCIKVPSLIDARLPFEVPPPSFSKDLFQRFDEEQWAFCAYEFKDGPSDVQILNDTIFPISQREEKGAGRTSTTWLVKIHPWYCFCANNSDDDGEPIDDRCTHEYIIKTYDGKTWLSETSYRSELNAFETLRVNEDAGKYIVKFYGSFTQDRSHNVILEYADQGTLADYYENVESPREENDTTDFWERLFNLAKALRQIHDVGHLHGEHDDGFHGVHQDIKPSNILVFSNGEDSPYRYTFKLADLGHSHFGSHDKSGYEVNHKVAVGTRTYGPPSHYVERQVNSKFINAEKKGDIWSLACVLSEAASWVTYGRPAIEEYRNRRTCAIARVSDFQDSDCFHTGSSVLPEVEAWHTYLAGLCRASDRVTPNIWQMLLQDCFKAHELRFSADQFLGRTFDLLVMQRAVTASEIYPSAYSFRPKSQVPSQLKRAHTHDASVDPPIITHRPQDSIGTSSSDMSYLQPTRKSGETSDASATPITSPASSRGLKASPGTPHTQRDFVSTGFGSPRAAEIPSSPPLFFDQAYPDLETLGQDEDMHSDTSPSVRQTRHGGNAESEPDATIRLSHLDTKGKTEVESSPDRQCPIHDTLELTVPTISVADVERWRSGRKLWFSGKENQKLPNQDYLNRVKGRNHMILVDDAKSMKEHWPEVSNFFSAFAYLTKTVDVDGSIDLCFTVSNEKCSSKKSSVLRSKVTERGLHLNATSNPETACDKILREWKKKANPSKLASLISHTTLPPVTLYILTDGVWEDRSDLSSFVKDVVDFMNQKDLSRKHIGIQFVQFGHDQRGTDRLTHLDTGLKNRLGKDIVDTEPSDGNILKVLLGPVDDTFDDLPKCICPRPEGST